MGLDALRGRGGSREDRGVGEEAGDELPLDSPVEAPEDDAPEIEGEDLASAEPFRRPRGELGRLSSSVCGRAPEGRESWTLSSRPTSIANLKQLK